VTFNAFEKTVESSQPIELFRFVLGVQTFEWTSSEDEVTVGSLTYTPEPIKRGSVSIGAEENSHQLEIEVPYSNAFAQQYLPTVPGIKATCTITRVQRADFPTPETRIVFEGEVQSVALTDDAMVAKILVMATAAATSGPIPRRVFGSRCGNVLYDDFCKVLRADFLFTSTVNSAMGLDLTIAGANAFGDGWFTAGEVVAGAGADRRLVVDHVGDVLTLNFPFPFTVAGTSVDCYAGCDLSPETCDSKFFTAEDPDSNLINFDGFAWRPLINPFKSGLV
jgi:uncharacterized phage protein (TIGR02218 family)